MRPCCVRVTQVTDQWTDFTGRPDQRPLNKVELIRQAPEFLGLLNPDQPLPRAAMLVPQSTSGCALVVVDEAGGLQLVGCPDQTAEGALAAMVSDLLAASGRFWHQPYKVVAGLFREALGIELTDWIRQRAGPRWDEGRFKSGLEKSLQEAKIPIVVLIDRLDAPIREMTNYLKNMNITVRLLSYEYYQRNGIELVRPVVPSGEPAPAGPVVRTGVTRTVQFTPTVTIKPADAAPRSYEPFPIDGTTPKQQDILKRLVYLDDLGLRRRGLEYFAPGQERKVEAEGTIVIACNQSRWPYPKPDEVLVVVRTSLEHLAGYLKMKPQDVVDFLSSLPREQRKEHKGCVVLRASNVYEANQLVNELKALKEVSQTGIR
ncbi:MAG: hypothetical protein ABIK44_00930 [candidate division WOR-3 bacterium]